MTKIDVDVPISVIGALAEALGFRALYDRRDNVDEWTISKGHGTDHVQYVGTRASVSAFLQGYSAMSLATSQILNDLDNGNRRLIEAVREKLK